jgi:N-methylhydantoinase B
LITERRVSAPWGLDGGGSGAPGENWLLPGGVEGTAEQLPDKVTRRLAAGDILRLRTPGGGGYGSPPSPMGRFCTPEVEKRHIGGIGGGGYGR